MEFEGKTISQLQSAIKFLKEEHRKTVEGLQNEINLLQRMCTKLTFQLAMKEGLVLPGSTTSQFKDSTSTDMTKTMDFDVRASPSQLPPWCEGSQDTADNIAFGHEPLHTESNRPRRQREQHQLRNSSGREAPSRCSSRVLNNRKTRSRRDTPKRK